MAVFLSDAWFSEVDSLQQQAGDLNVPSGLSTLALNITVTGTSLGDVDMCLNAGRFERGLHADAPTKLKLPAELARRIFIDNDQAAGMQGFMSGQIKVEGDMSKLMVMQSSRPSEQQKELLRKIKAITE